mgnify:CR=1 FL=1
MQNFEEIRKQKSEIMRKSKVKWNQKQQKV